MIVDENETSRVSSEKREGVADYSPQQAAGLNAYIEACRTNEVKDRYVSTSEEEDILLSPNLITDCARTAAKPNVSALETDLKDNRAEDDPSRLNHSSPSATNNTSSEGVIDGTQQSQHSSVGNLGQEVYDDDILCTSISTDNARPDPMRLELPTGQGDSVFAIEKMKQASSAKPKALTLDITKLEASTPLTSIKPNMEISGIEYRGLANADSGLKLPKAVAPAPMHFTDAVFNDSTNITIGNKIGTNGDIILNQYVDLSSNAIPQVTITDSTQSDKWYTNRKCITASVILAVVIMAALITTVTLIVLNTNKDDNSNDVLDPGADAPANYTLRVISRGQWTTHPNADIPDLRFMPARFVVVCHTAGAYCSRPDLCFNQVRNLEAWAISTGIDSISYNFLIGGDGYIYEGRGWNKEGAHTQGFNCASMAVAFIGEFGKDNLTPSMIEAFHILIDEGVRRGALTDDYKLFAAKQLKRTQSPGENVMKVITTWPHWSAPQQKDKFCPSVMT